MKVEKVSTQTGEKAAKLLRFCANRSIINNTSIADLRLIVRYETIFKMLLLIDQIKADYKYIVNPGINEKVAEFGSQEKFGEKQKTAVKTIVCNINFEENKEKKEKEEVKTITFYAKNIKENLAGITIAQLKTQSFLALSLTESLVFLHLLEKGMTKQEIMTEFEFTEITYKRIIARLNKLNYIYKEGKEYKALKCWDLEINIVDKKEIIKYRSVITIKNNDSFDKIRILKCPKLSKKLGTAKECRQSDVNRWEKSMFTIIYKYLYRQKEQDIQVLREQIVTVLSELYKDLDVSLEFLNSDKFVF